MAAASTAQVLYHHKGPKHGMGSNTIYYPYGMTSGVAISVDFEKSIYDWSNMIDVYDAGYTPEEGDAVAMLMRDLGVAARHGLRFYGPGRKWCTPREPSSPAVFQRYYGLTDVPYLGPQSATSAWVL